MKQFINILIYVIIGYVAMYTAIWQHEVGHAIVLHQYGCKSQIYDVHVPWHFGNSNPTPIIAEQAKMLDQKQRFGISIAGVILNIILGSITFLLLVIDRGEKLNSWVRYFLTMFCLAHLSEAGSYLTISNVFPTSDMINVLAIGNWLSLPLFIAGLGVIYLILKTIALAPFQWQHGLKTYVIVSIVLMGGLRLVFTLMS